VLNDQMDITKNDLYQATLRVRLGPDGPEIMGVEIEDI